MEVLESYESAIVSTRMRLARNFADYPFPNVLLKNERAVEQANEMTSILYADLKGVDNFKLYRMSNLPDETVALLKERNLISRDLIENKLISAAFINAEENISIMVNEEDHLRVQYFMKGLNLAKAYERVSGIDDIISDTIYFAYDSQYGYLTACPTNVGTGLRASVMLFLPALVRRGHMKSVMSQLSRGGLTVRGTSGEGSGTEGNLFQISNELTLGVSEADILELVECAVEMLTEFEIRERRYLKVEGGLTLWDEIGRSYGILLGCKKIDAQELASRLADIKLGIALGYIDGEEDGEKLMAQLDELMLMMRPANLKRISGIKKGDETCEEYRARTVAKAIKKMNLYL